MLLHHDSLPGVKVGFGGVDDAAHDCLIIELDVDSHRVGAAFGLRSAVLSCPIVVDVDDGVMGWEDVG